ncbi:MAG: hypothetical protein CVU73_06525 [Deltaproteobacteria bacterium HGW-Deltaproteobacteria-8]|jgi:MoaA/NifB/PqqE/SkfB family radical SAM enzyme|nr:MAG: hypothetical protein CVU73_06525 [Deltaproteobacteria bacterium HGW-Deltaproteobacteria-8]
MLSKRLRAWRDIFQRKGLLHGFSVLGNSVAARARRRFPALAPLLRTAPQTLDIEVSTICNLRCAGCLHGIEGGAFLREQQRFMPLVQFQSIMKQVGARAHAVNLTTFGEVFLNPDIYEIIACAKDYGMLVQVDTNGHKLDSERVLASGLDEIAFAVDGITQEAYETYRRGGRIDKVLENMRALHDLAEQSNHPISIQAKFIVTAFTEGEIEAARALFAASMPRVHFFTSYFRVPAPDWGFYRRHPFASTPELHAQWAPRTHKEFDLYVPDPASGLMQLNLLAMPFQNICPAMHGGMYIHGNGDAYPCCHAAGMEHPDFLLGNVFTSGVVGVFHGARAREIRREYDATGGRFSFCARCIANRLPGVPLRSSEAAGMETVQD